MRNMTEALYNRIEANASFAADVAHEIKNPLTSLRSAVETMRYAKSDDARERLLSVVEDDVRRMDRLVTDISNASRLDAELAKDEMEVIDLNKLLTNLVDYQKSLAEDREVDVLADLPKEEMFIRGNEGRLAQVFVNLITNAVSFVPPGGYVKVILRREGENKVRVNVMDTGPGIPKDNLKDIFKRFYSSRPEQEFGNNSGLGLAISKQIVEAHGGEIWAENIYENDDEDLATKGALFHVILPK
jgi:two-component system sensor histidine kinase ChvG